MGNRLREYREKQGISQVQLARLSGVSRGTILALENDSAKTTTTRTLAKLANALGTTVGHIFFGEDVQQLNNKQTESN